MNHHLRVECRPGMGCLRRLRVFPPLRLPELSVSELFVPELDEPLPGDLFPFFGVLFAFLRALRALPK